MANYKDLRYVFPASSIASGDIDSARLSNATFDDDTIQSKLATLGFKTATIGSLSAYNLTNQMIDEFADLSNVDASSSTNEILSSGTVIGFASSDETPEEGVTIVNGDGQNFNIGSLYDFKTKKFH